jgi:hypothetical protein
VDQATAFTRQWLAMQTHEATTQPPSMWERLAAIYKDHPDGVTEERLGPPAKPQWDEGTSLVASRLVDQVSSELFNRAYRQHFRHLFHTAAPVLEERDLVRDALYVLQGVQSATFVYDDATLAFLPSACRIHTTVRTQSHTHTNTQTHTYTHIHTHTHRGRPACSISWLPSLNWERCTCM